MTLTRDSLVLWLVIASSLLGYLQSEPLPPWQWPWHEWTKFAMFIVGVFLGKLQVSPLPSTLEVRQAEAEDIQP
jgi:hypothetical protein